MRKVLLHTIFILSIFINHALAADEVLFTVGDTKVNKSEFEYIYKKNNFLNKSNYSQKSLQDYLDLYTNFRLKVKEAIAQGLDTNARFREELNSYETQLLNSYVDKEVWDKLIKKEYERSKIDVNVSHIFFAINKDSSEDKAAEKALAVYKKIKTGVNFEAIAKEMSEDKQTGAKGGRVGWVNSFQISYPELEEAAYKIKVGEVTEPIKTRSGYHILKLNEIRPAFPKIKVAIIKRFFSLTDTTENAKKAVADSIQSAYSMLKKNIPFETVVQQYSEDDASKNNKGEVDWFGINTYAKVFEEKAYALKDGEFSAPFETKTAWYIVKRLQTAKPLTYDESIPLLKAKLANAPQYQYEMDKFVQYLTDKYKFIEYKENYPILKKRLEEIAENGLFRYRDTTSAKTLLQVDNIKYTENDYGKNIQELFYTVYPQQGTDKYATLIKNATQNFIIAYYKNELKNNNAEFKGLMDEYKNGMMIFNLSEQNIWNKASEDSIGLITYYNTHKDDFNLKKRATVRKITTNTLKQAQQIYKFIKTNPNVSDDSLLTEIRNNELTSAALNIQVIDENKLKPTALAASISTPKLEDGKYQITQIYNIQPAKIRSFEECRGYVVAAYQGYLEKQWLQQLRLKYPITINETVFESLVKK
ncbi:MAG: peptidylprolyl isomerase [Chitinophagales bacterium]